MGISRDLLKKIAGASGKRRGNVFKPGKYICAIENIQFSDGYKGECIIPEFRIVSSESVGDHEANSPATTAKTVYNLTGGKKSAREKAFDNCKAFALALMGYDEDEVSDDEFMDGLDKLVGKGNPGRGMVIRGETFEYEYTDDKGNDQTFVGMNWFHIKQTKADILEMRKRLDAGTVGKDGEEYEENED